MAREKRYARQIKVNLGHTHAAAVSFLANECGENAGAVVRKAIMDSFLKARPDRYRFKEYVQEHYLPDLSANEQAQALSEFNNMLFDAEESLRGGRLFGEVPAGGVRPLDDSTSLD